MKRNTRCSRCVLPGTFPGITFSEEGVCNFCLTFKGKEKLAEDKAAYFNKFSKLLEQVKGKNDYDCTLSFSGGKDSTYTLYIMKKVFRLRVLALTLDNGFLSPQARVNIDTVVEKLGVDSMVFKPDFNLLREIFRHAVDHPMYPAKTLERASTVCTSCIAFVKFVFLKIAIEKRIPLMAWGWSPGQAPLRSSIMKINPVLFKSTRELLRAPMREVVGNDVDRYFLSDGQLEDKENFPYNVSPLAFMEYNEQYILAKLGELGWRAPRDVDKNSTNCLLNSFANKIHLNRYAFHPYAFEIAQMVRTGVMSREEGLEKINDVGSEETIRDAREKLGID
ncbi:MAG: hypothetical protein GY950_17860 [bacterium]|nr:hypothetical protein [bacterium]